MCDVPKKQLRVPWLITYLSMDIKAHVTTANSVKLLVDLFSSDKAVVLCR